MKIYILGAGPAGLSLAYYLSKLGINSTVIELSGHLGGMARTWEWNNFLLETGPHLLHTPLHDIWSDWKELLGSNLIEQEFFSANYLSKGNDEFFFDYPLNLPQVLESNYWSPGDCEQIHEEISDKPNSLELASATSFSEYVKGLVGPTLSNSFYKKYPEKVWGISTDQMLPDWAPKRLRICEQRESFFKGQFSGVSALGSGDLFSKITAHIIKNGSDVLLEEPVLSLKTLNDRISAIITSKQEFRLDVDDLVVSTVPVSKLAGMLGLDYQIEFRGITSVYLAFEGISSVLPDPYSWLYYSEESVFNRITEPTKLSKSLNLLDKTRSYVVCERAFSLQNFASPEDLKQETLDQTIRDFQSMPMFSSLHVDASSINVEPWVYPIQTHGNKLAYREITSKIMKNKNIEMIGTGANYAYNDMQVIFKQAKELAKDIKNGPSGGSLLMSTFAGLCPSSTTFGDEADMLDDSPLIIAEIGINHNGDVERLMSLASAACNTSGIIKLQYFQAGERIGSDVREINHVEKAQDIEESISEVLSRCELSLGDIIKVKHLVESRDRCFMCTAFSIRDAQELVDSGISYIKTASMDLNNYPLHRWLAAVQKPLRIYISTGMSTSEEVEACVKIYSSSCHNISLLACTSSYPAPDNSLNLSSVRYFCQNFPGISIGYSDHSVGNNACLAALSYGAKVLEVHFTDDRRIAGPDQMLSKTNEDINIISSFGSFLNTASGSCSKVLHESEFFTWRSQRKSLFAKEDIPMGGRITYSNTVLRSPPLGVSPVLLESDTLFARQAIQQGQPITRSNVES